MANIIILKISNKVAEITAKLINVEITPQNTNNPSRSRIARENKQMVNAGNQFPNGTGNVIITESITQMVAMTRSAFGAIKKPSLGLRNRSIRISCGLTCRMVFLSVQ
jgi:hypothetical protein